MRATEILSNEHRVIERVLACLQAISEEAKIKGRLDARSAREAVEFFRTFADRCHHGKEEVHLFPALEAQGFPRHGGPTGVMLAEHDEGRAAVRNMEEQIVPAAVGDAAAVSRFVEHAQQFINLLREHIYKEDHVLFQLADRTLTETEQQSLLAAFQNVETEDMGAGAHERLLGIADRLAARYGVGPAVVTPPGAFHCCGHHY